MNFYVVVKKLGQYSGGRDTLKMEMLLTLPRIVNYQVITIVEEITIVRF